MKGYTSDDPDGNLDGCMNLRGSKSFGINIYAEKAICYFITAGYGTAATGQLMDVTVNGNKQIGSAPVDVTGEICTEGHAVGAINLNRGMNEIEFSLGAGSPAPRRSDPCFRKTPATAHRAGHFPLWA